MMPASDREGDPEGTRCCKVPVFRRFRRKRYRIQVGRVAVLGRWKFNKSDPSSVRVEVTQRDQFNNDDVSLATALVREALQNSSDAAVERTTPVKVSFRIKTLQSDESEMPRRVMGSLEQHLDACRLRLPSNVDGEIRVLCIEDYNTTGLTGSFEELDKENFDNFWRAVGESKKSGQQGGRWGLGKLVYSSASRIRSFFGLTMREDDDGPSMMGQAVLSNHNIGEEYYPAHGFWFDRKSSVPPALQLPVSDTDDHPKI